MKPNKKELVWVTWRDAESSSTRTHVEDLADVRLSRNVNLGWVIHENDKRIVLAHGFCTSGEVDHFAIPRGDIESIELAAVPQRKAKNGLPQQDGT